MSFEDESCKKDYLRFTSKYSRNNSSSNNRNRNLSNKYPRRNGNNRYNRNNNYNDNYRNDLNKIENDNGGGLSENDLRNKLRLTEANNVNINCNKERERENRDKIEEESIDIDLLKEYLQWDLINNELYEKCAEIMSVRGQKQRQELTNTIQRWLIHINEQYNRVPKYEWFCLLPSVTVDHSAAIFLRDAIVEKRFVNDRSSADKAIERLFGFIRDKHKSIEEKYGQCPTDDRALLHLEFDPERQLVVVEKFQSEELDRVAFLVEKGGLLNTARLLLRYESFGNGSYQWGDPRAVHHVLYEKFGVRFEGFASPLNSRFIVYSDTGFCSLFPDTDRVFGSLGDFFHVDMERYRGGWSVNPPFVNDLMLCVAERIEAVLETGPHWWFFCTFPCWDDDPGWIKLNSSKHLVKRFDLKPAHFIVQNAYGDTFEPAMKMNMFVLGEIPPEFSRLTELGNILVLDSYNSHEPICPW